MKVLKDEDYFVIEPCVSCEKHYVEDIWWEDCCDMKRCIHAEEYHKCMECASEHRQLAEWLRELKAYREALKNGDLRGCRNCKYTDVDILDYPCATCEKTDLWEVNADE